MSEKRFELRKYGDSWEVYDDETSECYTIHNFSDILNNLCGITLTYPNLVGEIEIGKLLVNMALKGQNGKVVIVNE